MKDLIASLIRDLGLGLFINGLFTITQNGFSFNAVIVTLVSVMILFLGIFAQKHIKDSKWTDKQ